MKGNKMGIKLIIPPEATLLDVINLLKAKLQNNGHYCKADKPISVIFEGKSLTEEEKQAILDTLRENGLTIQDEHIQTICDDPPSIKKENKILPDKEGLFYRGTLRNGQTLFAADSIVIIGDVEAGASVYSEGNIVIIGTNSGVAESGYKGRKDTFVYSFQDGRKHK